MRKLTTEDFIIKAKLTHGDRYDYSLVDYIGSNINVNIICDQHGIFEQIAKCHVSGYNCPKCAGKYHKDTLYYIEQAKSIHGNLYDYSLVDYIGSNKKIKIMCKIHGEFIQSARKHLNKQGCPKCALNFKKDTEHFISKSKLIHNDLYDYTNVDYTGCHIKVKILCNKHGIFEQNPNNHLLGKGCPICKCSKGEITIKELLEKNNIKYKQQFGFKKCKFINKLLFDFYLLDYNICIEYNGKQHYESIDYFGGEKSFKMQIIKDNIKKEFCLNNNIPLLVISYKENTEETLTDYIGVLIGEIGEKGPIDSIDVTPAYKSFNPLIS